MRGTRRIVHVYLRPADYTTGGVNRAAQEWAARMSDRAGLPTCYVQAEGGFTDELASGPQLSFERVRVRGRRRSTMVPRGLRTALRDGDVVYLHEGWTLSNLLVAAHCRRRGIPYVVMPHGVYERPVVQALRARRVRAALERRMLSGAAAVHLFFETERMHLSEVAPSAEVLVAATGVTGGTVIQDGATSAAPYLAWLARFDIRHKGVDVLLAAFAGLPPAARPRLRMAGPDHGGDRRRVVELVRRLGLEPWVSVEGELGHDDARAFLAGSRALVHTPRWECYGVVVAEALDAGTAVVIGDAAHIAGPLAAAGLVTTVALEPRAIGEELLRAWSVVGSAQDAARRRRGAHDVLGWARGSAAWEAGMTGCGLLDTGSDGRASVPGSTGPLPSVHTGTVFGRVDDEGWKRSV